MGLILKRGYIMKKKSMAGFTLIEAVVTMSIIAILSAIALPSYIENIKKGRRADAKTGLLSLQMAQEKFRANCPGYAKEIKVDTETSCANRIIKHSDRSPDGHYKISVASADATSYTLKATREGKQSDDKCGNFTINQAGTKGVEYAYSGYDAAKCW